MLHFYERNLVGRGQEFDESPDDKPDFNKYAVELRFQNLVADTKKTPIPSLPEDLAEATTTLLAAVL